MRGRRGLTATVALICAAWALPAAARAYEITPPTPEQVCAEGVEAEEHAIDYSRQPSTPQAQGGAPVIFSAEASVPVTFVVSLSPDAGAPLLETGSSTPQPGTPGKVSFASARAGETRGALYWTIEFQSTAMAECATLPARTITLPMRQLFLLAPTIAPTPETPAPAPVPAPTPAPTAPRCKVPVLLHLTLTRAEATLREHHCRLGHLSRPAHARRRPLVVTAQGTPPGRSERDGALVAVTLGEPHRHRA